MSRQNRSQRALLRRPRAAFEAARRKALDVFERARQRVREGDHPASDRAVMDALAEQHHELGAGGRDKLVFVGYGPIRPAERPRQREGRMPSLAERTGLHRRTCQAAMRRLVEAGIVHKQFGDGRPEDVRTAHVPCRRERYLDGDRVRYRAVGELCAHQVGRGGCDKGGLGLANGYWVDGVTPPEPPPAPPRDPDPPPPARQTPAGWERAKAIADRMVPGRPRGP